MLIQHSWSFSHTPVLNFLPNLPSLNSSIEIQPILSSGSPPNPRIQGFRGRFFAILQNFEMGPSEKDLKDTVVSQLAESVKEISLLPECNGICKKMYGDLIRRVKLLSPLFEELRDGEEELGLDVLKGLELLKIALDSATELLRSVSRGSKLFQVLNSAFSFLFLFGC